MGHGKTMTKIFLILAIAFNGASGAEQVSAFLLERVAVNVTTFWEKFSTVTCTETVEQQKLEPGGKVLLEKKAIYDYLILLQRNGEELFVEESRVAKGKPGKENDRPLLATTGFSALLLIFHPIFQSSFTFSAGPDERDGDRVLRRIQFRHRKGERSPSVLQLHGRNYPIAWEGSAWVDGETGAIARIEAGLQEPMLEIGLLRLSSAVRYSPFQPGANVWLPSNVTIEASTRKQRWHNTHSFNRYREFAVDTEVRMVQPED